MAALHCEESSAEPGFLCVKVKYISDEEYEYDTNSQCHLNVFLVTSSMFPVVVVNNMIPNFFFFFFFFMTFVLQSYREVQHAGVFPLSSLQC